MELKMEGLLRELHKLTGELEGCLKDVIGDGVGEASERVRARLTSARESIAGIEERLQDSLKRGTQAADNYVRTNPWQSIGIAVAVAFIVGALLSRRD